jgi:hypothetical protein
VERVVEQEKIQKHLHDGFVAVAHGPNGSGKTELAAHQACSTLYDHVWWIPAAGENSIRLAYHELLNGHNITLSDETPMPQLQQAIGKLITPCGDKWLVVYDRFEGHAFHEVIAKSPWSDARAGKWDVIITSQESIQDRVANIPVGSMQRNETMAYYGLWADRTAGMLSYFQSAPQEDRDALANALGDHPFFFASALWTILRAKISTPEFLDRYREAGLQSPDHNARPYDRSADAIIDLSLAGLHAQASSNDGYGRVETATAAIMFSTIAPYFDTQDMSHAFLSCATSLLIPNNKSNAEAVITLLQEAFLLQKVPGNLPTSETHYRMLDIQRDWIAQHALAHPTAKMNAWSFASRILQSECMPTAKEGMRHMQVLTQDLPTLQQLDLPTPPSLDVVYWPLSHLFLQKAI